MSSKSAKRAKRKEAFKTYNPQERPAPKEKEPEYVNVPGQRFCRIGGAFLLIGGFLSAIVVYFAVKNLNDMNAEQMIGMTEIAGQTPMLYITSLALTSVAAVFQFIFGYNIFRNARNPFLYKRTMIMAIIMLLIELGINIYVLTNTSGPVQYTSLIYGCIIPGFIIWGAYKNKKFVEKHPDYIPPEPTQMF